MGGRVSCGFLLVGGRRGRREPLLHHLLRLPGAFRPPGALLRLSRAQLSAVPGHEAGPGPPRESVPREPQEGVQEAARLQLHDPHADRGGHRLPSRGNSAGRPHPAAHHLVRHV